jgi:hypothetical protein
MRLYSLIGFVLIVVFLLWWRVPQTDQVEHDRYHGVSLESPPKPIDSAKFSSVMVTQPSHVAIIPYAFTRMGSSEVIYNRNHSWWGESYPGVIELVSLARKEGLDVMLKPHVWIQGQGWAGDFDLEDEESWKIWEESYRPYILDFARLADSLEVPVFCVGTEYRLAAIKRADYWKDLISDVRSVYSGKITYAANWDNYQKIDFWDDLDLIGVDAYFPLDTTMNPKFENLQSSWMPICEQLRQLSAKHQKPILFTEFGYRSVSHTAGPDWELDGKPFDEYAQQVAYQALFESVWDQPWFAGGFLWKWRFYDEVGGVGDTGFTPQGKKAEATIATYYRTVR